MSEVLLHIRGSQVQDGVSDEVELTTKGWLRFEGETAVLGYDDSEDAAEDTQTVIRVRGGVITMQKTGKLETQFIFERGKDFITEYKTPFGTLGVTLYPTLVDAKMGEQQGRIELEYVLDIAGVQVVNRLNLHYTAPAGDGPAGRKERRKDDEDTMDRTFVL